METAWREAIRKLALDEPKRARELYTALLTPVESVGLLRPQSKIHNLVVVADGAVLDVPFAALVDRQGYRLVERFSVSSAFSLASLTWEENHSKPAGNLFAVADTTGGESAHIGKPVQMASTREGQGKLKYAEPEVRTIARLYPQSFALIGDQGREGKVKQEAGKYGLLHFAVHGQANGKEGLASYLVLAPEPMGSGEDGILEAREIVNLPLRARLAVLSACETAQGQKSGGEGLIGLAWAFRAAGVPAIVASQWKVEDEATAKLMVAFYHALKSGKRKDEALRTAMLSVMKEKPQPYYWAAFQVIGDTTPLPSLPAFRASGVAAGGKRAFAHVP